MPKPHFKEWVFYDTNCLSLLIKEVRKGSKSSVSPFVRNQPILLTPYTLLELFKSGDHLIDYLLPTLEGSLTCVTPDPMAFWKADILNYICRDVDDKNSALKLCHLSQEYVDLMKSDRRQVIEEERQKHLDEFLHVIAPVDEVTFEERHLLAFIFDTIQRTARSWWDITVHPHECVSSNFPSFYIFAYAHWYRYIKQPNTRPERNDFADLLNITAAPYCRTFYTEKSFGNTLRQIKNYPKYSYRKLLKELRKTGDITGEQFHMMTEITYPQQELLLHQTDVFTYQDLKEKLS